MAPNHSKPALNSPNTLHEGGVTSIVFSPETQLALSGGQFDARVFFRKAKLTNIDEVDERAKLIYRNKVKLMDLLCQNEDLVAGALGWVEDKVMGVSTAKKTSAAVRDVPNWPATYIYMEKVPKYWRAEFLAKNMGHHGLNTMILKQIDESSPTAITEMFDYLLAFHNKTKIPRVCLDKEIMMSFSAERLNDLGRGSTEWLHTLFDGWTKPFTPSWGKAGCFSVLEQSGTLILKYVSGAQVHGPKHEMNTPSPSQPYPNTEH